MEFILQNTDIFDEEIDVKFNNLIIANKDKFITGTVYEFTVSFSVYLLKDIRFEEFKTLKCKTSKNTKHDVLSFQLEKLIDILDINGIEVYSTRIHGDILESKDIIKIEFPEDNSKPMYSGRGNNKRRMKSKWIVPNKPYAIINTSLVAAKIDPKFMFAGETDQLFQFELISYSDWSEWLVWSEKGSQFKLNSLVGSNCFLFID